eukprot:1149496-Pelagomonas_calceolata.AAC.4
MLLNFETLLHANLSKNEKRNKQNAQKKEIRVHVLRRTGRVLSIQHTEVPEPEIVLGAQLCPMVYVAKPSPQYPAHAAQLKGASTLEQTPKLTN